MDEDKIEIGLRFRNYAELYFKSSAHFARELGVSPQSLTNYYNGRNIPGGELLIKLLRLGCNIEWLLVGKGEPLITASVTQTKTNYSAAVGENNGSISVNDSKTNSGSAVDEVAKLGAENERLLKHIDRLEKYIERIESINNK
jgi:transcriptional regulator with XRE-family HTH domain